MIKIAGVLILILFVSLSSAALSYDNPNLPKLEANEEPINILTFLGLTDTPATYTGSGGWCVVVNATETKLDLAPCNSTATTNCPACDTRFLRLDASNDPLTSDLEIFDEPEANITFRTDSNHMELSFTDFLGGGLLDIIGAVLVVEEEAAFMKDVIIVENLSIGTILDTDSVLNVNGTVNITGDTRIDDDLNVTGSIYFDGNLIPITTLTSNIGAGANRILWLYVHNISAEYIDTFSLTASDNISAEYFNGSGAYLTELNISGDITGYDLNISFLYGHAGIGGLDLRGDPWYFSGADWEYDSNLTAHGNITADWFVGGNIYNYSLATDYMWNSTWSAGTYNETAVNNSIDLRTGNLSTYNTTYNLYAYNQSQATDYMYNDSWFSTSNASYDLYAYNQSQATDYMYNDSWFSTYNATYDANQGNATWNESHANTLYWMLNGSNAPPTADWNMGDYGFANIGNSTFNGTNYSFNAQEDVSFYVNGSKWFYFNVDGLSIDFLKSLILQAGDSITIGALTLDQQGISKTSGDLILGTSDAEDGGTIIQGMFECNANSGDCEFKGNPVSNLGSANTDFDEDGNLVMVGTNISAENITATNITATGKICDSVGCIGSGGGGNVFDQDLNTTSNVTFNELYVAGMSKFNNSIFANYSATKVALGRGAEAGSESIAIGGGAGVGAKARGSTSVAIGRDVQTNETASNQVAIGYGRMQTTTASAVMIGAVNYIMMDGYLGLGVSSGVNLAEILFFPNKIVLNTSSSSGDIELYGNTKVFNNFTVQGDVNASGNVKADCIESCYVLSWQENEVPTYGGYQTLSGGVNQDAINGRHVTKNSTIESFHIRSTEVIDCSTQFPYIFFLQNGTGGDISNVSAVSMEDVNFNETENINFDIDEGDELRIYGYRKTTAACGVGESTGLDMEFQVVICRRCD